MFQELVVIPELSSLSHQDKKMQKPLINLNGKDSQSIQFIKMPMPKSLDHPSLNTQLRPLDPNGD
jgi:hypothetical protein